MTDPNEDQRDYWSSAVGATWAAQAEPMDYVLAPVLNAVIDAAQLKTGDKVLDVGCGAGTSTLTAAAQVRPDGSALGVDISKPLLDAARSKAASVDNVTFQDADAQVSDFKGTRFDVAISRFGVMFFNDFTAAFGNIREALKPNGRIAFATWGIIPENPFFTMPAAAAKATLGAVPKSDPDEPGPFALREVVRFERALNDAGFSNVSVTPTTIDLPMRGTPMEAAGTLCKIGPAHRALKYHEADEKDEAYLRTALAAELQSYMTPNGIVVPSLINIATAEA